MKSWQHGVVAQTLYSGRCTSDSAPYFDYGLAQARSDIFFSLLFGGTVNCSAGAFFDSPTAIRVFGELMSHPLFEATRLKVGWTPLRLHTDNPAKWDGIRAYVAERWRNPAMKFALFRELDADFKLKPGEDTNELRKKAADAIISGGHPGQLPNALEPFLKAVSVARDVGGQHLHDEDGNIMTGSSFDAVYSPILKDPVKSAVGLEAILRYVDGNACFHSMAEEIHREVLGGFSPLRAINTRTDDIVKRVGPDAKDFAIGNFELDDLIESNARFKAVAGSHSHMNALHSHGSAIYRHFFPLIRQWIEADWHGTRHKAYTSSACLYSTNWEAREVMDFDSRAKAFYLEPGQIDDALRLAQERFGELDWGILLGIISLDEWPLHVLRVRSAKTKEAASNAAEALLNLLAKSIVDFNFQIINGRLSVSAKVAAGAAAVCASAASVCLSHFESSLVSLAGAGALSATAGALGGMVKGASSAAIILPGARWVSERYVDRALRTAITPATYLGAALGTSP